MSCVLFCILKVVDGAAVPEVMRCVLLCMLRLWTVGFELSLGVSKFYSCTRELGSIGLSVERVMRGR